MPSQSEIRAAIAKVSAIARQQVERLDSATAEKLLAIYQDAAKSLRAEIAFYADDAGNLRLDVLRELLQQVDATMDSLQVAQRELLRGTLRTSAALGAGVWTSGESVTLLADSALRFVENFVAADGLKLSERLWRVESGAVQRIADTLRRNVVMGRDASQAAAEFLARGEAVPLDIKATINLQRASNLAGAVDAGLIGDDNPAYGNALRVFRTELNRAHGEAYQAGAGSHPDVVGMRFTLSPNHPRVDICDYYASANLYGLGEGVYPVGQAPWPAHPNTMSYVTAVFRDEVSEKDQAGQRSPLAWLREQPEDRQAAILGTSKAAALRAGVLNENDITTPWRDLRDGFEQRGYAF